MTVRYQLPVARTARPKAKAVVRSIPVTEKTMDDVGHTNLRSNPLLDRLRRLEHPSLAAAASSRDLLTAADASITLARTASQFEEISMTQVSENDPKSTSEVAQPSDIPGGWTAAIVVSLVGMVLVQEFVSLGFTSVSIAMPFITSHFASTQGGWLLTGFTLMGAVASPLLGKLADIYGKRKVLLAVLVITAVGALIAATAQSMTVLILGRCLEGTSMAGMFLCYSLMRDIYPTKILPLAISICLTGTGILTISVPFMVGSLLDRFGFRGLFWFDLGILVVLFVLVLLTTPESPLRQAAKPDLVGGLLLGGGVAFALVGISQGASWGWTSMAVIGCFLAGAAVLALFTRWSLHTQTPVVNLRHFANRPLIMVAITSAMAYGALTLSSTVLPMIAMAAPGNGYGLGLTATGYAALASPMFFTSTVSGFVLGKTVTRVGARNWLMIGCLMYLTEGVLLAAGLNDTFIKLLVVCLLSGLGAGFTMAAIPNLVVKYAPARDQGSIAGSVHVMTSSFSSFAPVLMFAILASSVTMSDGMMAYEESGFQNVAWLLCAFSGGALLLFFTLFSSRKIKA